MSGQDELVEENQLAEWAGALLDHHNIKMSEREVTFRFWAMQLPPREHRTWKSLRRKERGKMAIEVIGEGYERSCF